MLKQFSLIFTRNYMRNFLIFFALILVCSLFMGSVLVRGNKDIKRSDSWITHSYTIISEARDLSTLAEAMLVDQYEFSISKDEDILARYDRHKEEFSNKIAHLSDLAEDNPGQISRLQETRQRFTDFTAHLEERSAARLAGKTSGTKEGMILSARLKKEISRTTQAIIEEESELLNTRLQNVEAKKDYYFVTLIIGGILSFMLLMALNGFLMHVQSARTVAERNLEEVEERLKLALRGSSDGIFDWDLRNDDIYWSSEYKSMLGYGEDELMPSRALFNSLIHPEDQKIFWDAYHAYIAGKKKEFMAVFRMRHKSGRWIWINSRGKALFDHMGTPTRFIGAHTDISHLKEYEIKLQEIIDRAEYVATSRQA